MATGKVVEVSVEARSDRKEAACQTAFVDVGLDGVEMVSVTSNVAPDGGFGWVVVSATFLIGFILSGFMKSFGVMRAAIFAEFPATTPSEGAWISGLIGTLSLVCSPVTGMLMGSFGFRPLVFAGGLLCVFGLALSYFATSAGFLVGSLGTFMGVGSSLVYTSAIVCVGKYFTTKRPAAMAVALSGGCVGAMALPSAINGILLALGLRYTFLVLAGLFVVICLCALAFGPPEAHFDSVCREVPADQVDCDPPAPQDPERDERSALARFGSALSQRLALRFLADPAFLLTTASVFAMGMGNPHFLHSMTQKAEVLGIAREPAMMLLAYAAVGDLVARLGYGMLASRSPFPRSAEYASALVVSAVAVVLVPFCTSYGHLIGTAVAAGLGTGVWTILTPLLLGVHHGVENMNGTFTLLRLFQGCANLVFPPASGALKASFGTHAAMLFIGGNMCAAAVFGILLHLVALVRGRKKVAVDQC